MSFLFGLLMGVVGFLALVLIICYIEEELEAALNVGFDKPRKRK